MKSAYERPLTGSTAPAREETISYHQERTRTILDGLCRGAGGAHEYSFKRVYPPLVNSGPETALTR